MYFMDEWRRAVKLSAAAAARWFQIFGGGADWLAD
jgi:hypothetical protein